MHGLLQQLSELRRLHQPARRVCRGGRCFRVQVYGYARPNLTTCRARCVPRWDIPAGNVCCASNTARLDAVSISLVMFDKFREECGVFGILHHKDAANLVYLGLYALQHRGQESAGIASLEPGSNRILSEKDMGYVADIFDEARIAKLPGDTALGHVRYSTAGGSLLCNAQPPVASTSKGPIAVAHNGNPVNGADIPPRLQGAGALFNTMSDTQGIVHLIRAVKEARLEGALVASVSPVQSASS